jgi:hypothetical protein
MEVPPAWPQEKEPPTYTDWEAGWGPGLTGRGGEEKNPCSSRESNPGRPVRSLVGKVTELSPPPPPQLQSFNNKRRKRMWEADMGFPCSNSSPERRHTASVYCCPVKWLQYQFWNSPFRYFTAPVPIGFKYADDVTNLATVPKEYAMKGVEIRLLAF